MATSTDSERAATPVRRARFATYGLAVALAIPVVSGIELWPLSQFELFSGTRTGTGVSYELVTVDAADVETPVDLALIPANLGRVLHLLPRLGEESPADQREMVGLWVDAAGGADTGAVTARVYAVRRTVPTDAGEVPTVLDRSLVDEVQLQ